MKSGPGKEMRSLILAVSLSVLVLVIAIVAYFMVDIIVTTNNNIEEDKQKLIAASVRSLQDMKSVLSLSDIGPQIAKLFNPELVDQLVSGDVGTLYEYIVDITLSFYPIDYVGIIVNGQTADYGTRKNAEVDPGEISVIPPEGDYETYDRLFGKDGFFISVFFPADLGMLGIGEGEIYVNMIVDRSEQLKAIEDYFGDQRNDLILRLSIVSAVAILLSILLTTVGLRYFTRKYVVKPIEALNRTAEEIADGSFEGEVRVDEDSAYAALQGLLRSGQKVLNRMDEEIGG